MDSPLYNAIQQALLSRATHNTPIADLAECTPSAAPDLFSNDYLSITSDPLLRHAFLDALFKCPNIFGAGGSRLLGGNPPKHVQFEARMKETYNAPAALLCNSGYDANVALFSCLPQKGDVIIFDELVHASTRDGVSASRAKGAQYAFAHNSTSSLKETLILVLQRHRNITEGKGTIFIAVESLYSMDGDLVPLTEIVALVEEFVPKNCAHIVVDEAHSTGLYGKGGRGIVSMLGLNWRVHTVLHTFGKARGFSGAILLTSSFVKNYIANYARPFIFSTALPHVHISALDASFDYIMSSTGQKRMDRLQYLCLFFETRLINAIKAAPDGLLILAPKTVPAGYPKDIRTPIFPILTRMPISLARHLQSLGYACQAIPYPAVPKGQERIRVTVHAGNTESELDGFIKCLMDWVCTAQHLRVDTQSESLHLARL